MVDNTENNIPTHRIEVDPKEWAAANAYFALSREEQYEFDKTAISKKYENKPEEIKRKLIELEKNKDEPIVKLKKNAKDPNSHSFIRALNSKTGQLETYVVANSYWSDHLLGQGSFGKVRVAQNEDGKSFAVKIEGREAREKEDVEKNIMEELDYLKGEAVRHDKKRFMGKRVTAKLYTVTELKPGDALLKEKYENYTTRLLIAIKACEALQVLHDKRIIHADIKGDNFLVDKKEDGSVVVSIIDFGLSKKLPEDKDVILHHETGAQDYQAPEIAMRPLDTPAPFSLASDIYALGTMFEKDLSLNSSTEISALIAQMTDEDINERGTIEEIIVKLQAEYNLQHLLVIGDNQEAIKKFFHTNPIPDANAILCWAAESNQISIANTLLKYQSDYSLTLDCTDKRDNTPLMLAAKNGHIEMLSCLIDKGADINAFANNGHSALTLAIKHNNKHSHQRIIESLIEKDPQNAVILALKNFASQPKGSLPKRNEINKMVNQLVKLVSPLNDNIGLELAVISCQAAQKGHPDIVKTLIPHLRFNKELQNKAMKASLFLAAEYGHDNIAEALKEALKKTALISAVTQGDLKEVKALCAEIKKSNIKSIDFKTDEGITPLMAAAKIGRVDVVEFLIKNGANVNAINTATKESVLMIASNAAITKQLIDTGADIHYKHPKTRLTALQREPNEEKRIILESAQKLENAKKDFDKKWDSFEKIEKKYFEAGKMRSTKVRLFFKYTKPEIPSEIRKAQLELLEKSIANMSKAPNDNEILNVFKTIGYLKANLKDEDNRLPTRLEKVLVSLEAALLTINPDIAPKIQEAKIEGMAHYQKQKMPEKPISQKGKKLGSP